MLETFSKTPIKTGLAGLFLFVGMVVPAVGFADVSDGMNDPKLLFEKMWQAKHRVPYRGSLTYQINTNPLTFRVDSSDLSAEGRKTLESLSGVSKSYEVMNRTDCPGSISIAGLSSVYNFSYVGPRRVAGREAHEILLRPVDPYRLGYSYFIDQETGLKLRSSTMRPDRSILEHMQFVEVEILVDDSVEELDSESTSAQESENSEEQIPDSVSDIELEPLETVEQTLSQVQITSGTELADSSPLDEVLFDTDNIDPCEISLEDSKWVLSWVPQGFRLARYSNESGTSRFVYEDGISTYSVFIEPVMDKAIPTGNTQHGAALLMINYYSTPETTHLITFVGEVPIATGERVIAGLRQRL